MVNLLENLVSANITAEDLAIIVNAFDLIEEKMPFLLNITKEDLKPLALLHDANRTFCEDVLVEMRQWKDPLPAGIVASELEKDLEFTRTFKNIVVRAEKLDLRLYCTFVRAGAEAYNMSLKFRDYMGLQSSFNSTEAKVAFEKVSRHFNEQAAKAAKTRSDNATAKAAIMNLTT